jgi:hypothetical protein
MFDFRIKMADSGLRRRPNKRTIYQFKTSGGYQVCECLQGGGGGKWDLAINLTGPKIISMNSTGFYNVHSLNLNSTSHASIQIKSKNTFV